MPDILLRVPADEQGEPTLSAEMKHAVMMVAICKCPRRAPGGPVG